MTNALLSEQDRRLIHALQILGDETRFKMFKLMLEKNDLCVSEIAQTLGVSVSAVSQHFRNFELLHIVKKQRHGQRICYLINETDPFVKQLYNLVCNN
ncbi:MAG TPA: winged helix-turn-helix domain-containing protein [Candidatus Saccharibacteria bacterium]|jgi:predicted transcriptional regulator|nr:winged helix-turn-helix domain-containing protein [Candidatus Saccharibacteria bacterium]HMT56019.1 winged helix-turn-helix domain-containing protein [Candidatus Saccharibacteria bacterium]